MNELSAVSVWGWFVLAVILLGAEILLPGAFMIWLGLAAAVTGVVSLAWPLSWPWAFLLFAVLGVIFAVIGRRIARRVDASDRHPVLNRRADALVGQTFTLAEPIEHGEGRIRVGDTIWRLRGPDLPAGTRIVILRNDGGRLEAGRDTSA